MELKECVKKMEPALLQCLQENLRIPSVQGEPEPGAPYGAEVRKREHYEKPSVKRKKKSEAARKRKFK